MIKQFTIPGPLKGYRKGIRESYDPRYKEWKEAVAMIAVHAGVRVIPGPEQPVWVGVEILWRGKPRIDWKNVIGAIEDAMFPTDRWVMPGHHNVVWDTGQEEEARVTVEWETRAEGPGAGLFGGTGRARPSGGSEDGILRRRRRGVKKES